MADKELLGPCVQVLFIQGGMQMMVAEIVVGILLAVQFNAHSGQPIDKGIGTGVIVLICLFIAGFGWSWGPLVCPPITSHPIHP